MFILGNHSTSAEQQQLLQSQINRFSSQHLTVTSERRLFDSIKDYLSSTSPRNENWLEFIKCLDLFSVDSINKKELIMCIQVYI